MNPKNIKNANNTNNAIDKKTWVQKLKNEILVNCITITDCNYR